LVSHALTTYYLNLFVELKNAKKHPIMMLLKFRVNAG
jgi:hypothetical protein